MRIITRNVSLLCACLFCSPLFAQSDFNIDLVSSVFDFWGSVCDIEVTGDYAYVSAGEAGFFIIDIGDPAHPVQVGHFHSPGYVAGSKVVGDYAYVADGYKGLCILNISDRTDPQEVGRYRIYNSAYSVDVSGNYAYVTANNHGLKIIDVGDPAHPDQIATFNTDANIKAVKIVGNLCYLANGTDGMRILDISNPHEPVEVGLFETPHSTFDSNQDIYIYGRIALLACLDLGFYLVDVSDPTQPFMLSYVGPLLDCMDITAYNNIVYIADHNDGMRAYDISNPANPTYIDSYTTLGRVDNVAVANNLAFVLDYYTGLHIVDLDDHNFLEEVSNINEGSIWETKTVGNLIYAACGFDGLHIIDASNPAHPLDIGCFDIPRSQTFGLDVVGDYAYLADWADGLRIIDVSDPSTPEFVSEISTPGLIGCVDVVGDYAYLGGKYEGFRIVDVSNPESPVALGSVLLDHADVYGDEQVFDVVVILPYAYVTNYAGGLRIIDVSNPNAPFEIGFIDDMPLNNVCISDTLAYASYGDGFHVISISDPTQPGFICEYRDSDLHYSRGIAIQGDYLFLATSSTGLFIFDVSSPTAPVVTGYYDTGGFALELEVIGDYTYLADTYTVSIFDHSAAVTAPESMLSGTLRDSCTQLPIADAEIVLTNYHEYTGVTDENGHFAFDVLFPLTYAISINAAGMVPYVDSITVSEGPNDCTINLIPNPQFEAIAEEEYQFTLPPMGSALDSFVIRNAADCSADLTFRVLILEDDIEGRPLNQNWIAVSVDSGTIAAGEQVQIRIIIDASLDSLNGVARDCFLVVTTNDPDSGYYGAWVYLTVEPQSASELPLPTEFAVMPPYPNPFNPSVTIPLTIPSPGMVNMAVYNLMGQIVYSMDRFYPIGSHQVLFDSQNDGLALSSGMYFLQVRYQDQVQRCRLLLMK